MPENDTFANPECKGVVTDPPCPVAVAPTTEVLGNLVVRQSSDSGIGGTVHIEGSCSDDGCHSSGLFNVTIDGNLFDVNSAGSIALRSANTDRANQKGSEIVIKSGDGTNPVGGSGGDVVLESGSGSGGKWHV